jgi:peptidoglycan-N-acetylglucosamine deacetylase
MVAILKKPHARSVAALAALVAPCLFLGAIATSQSVEAKSTCVQGPKSLGVSRTVEIDTATGPRFGHQQYQDINFLSDGEVVLTFDDGPLRPYTQPVIDALDAQCVKATFFMVGSMALGDPSMVREIIARGHTVGTHTWSHANLKKLTPLKARAEFELGFSAVQQAAGQPIAPFFRFPFLADAKSMISYAQTRQTGVFSIEVDAIDYRTKDPAVVHQNVLNQLATMKKGILLFHDIQPATARALPGLLAALKAKGYRVVHMKPKGRATTLAEFDAMAQKESGRRRVATAANPLAPRSLTWQAGSPPPGAPEPSNMTTSTGVPKGRPIVRAGGVPPVGSSVALPPNGAATQAALPQALPQGAAGVGARGAPNDAALPPPLPVAVPLPPPVLRPSRGPVDEDWRTSVFRR